MEYNKTKRGLEKAAGIVGIVFGAFLFISSLISLCGVSFLLSFMWPIIDGGAISVVGILEFMLSAVMIVLSSIICYSPVISSGKVCNRTKIRIWLIVIYVVTENIISLGLIIAVLFLKDFPVKKTKRKEQSIDTNSPETQMKLKIEELKKLKELYVIDEEAYKKSVDKVIDEYKKSL